ncbi:nSTAND1 domain-containing NTPase [Paraglaciecola algarum]|uniref:nSTAND1 domain-containing NTPase n=1 Tax=Paraglaciecola algarum TaxID=3050085 RepID=UPI0032EA142E
MTKQLEPKAMDVLVLLCQQQGEVLSAEQIISQCWGNADMGDNPIHKAITQLRKALDDKASAPTYIETIRKRGYRVIANIEFPLSDTLSTSKTNWQNGSPFPGLSAFDTKEASVFFGRNAQILNLLERLSVQINQGRGFCLLLGPSGTGKSSLVNAGLLPRLLCENGFDGFRVLSYTTLDLADVAKNRLFVDLASTMLDWDINGQVVFENLSADTLAEKLRSNIAEVLSLLSSFMQINQNSNTNNQLFIFIDRLEVILSSPLFNDFERQQFIGLMDLFASTGHVIVVSACRNDFYPLLAEYKTLMDGKDSGAHFDLMPPTRNELMHMIRLPAEAAGLTWALDQTTNISLDEILCEQAARHPDSLPMLQYTLQELYLQRSEKDELLYSVYQELGGIEGAIGKKAEEVFIKLPKEQQVELAYLLSQLVTVNAEDESAHENITSRAARWSQLTNQAQKELVQAMVDSRLFVSHLKQGQACFSLAHEALLRRWPRAAKWISEHQESLTIKSRLQQLSEKWIAEGKSTAYLLAKGKPLLEAKALQTNPIFALSSQEQDFINASQKQFKNRLWLSRMVIACLCFLTITSVFMSIKSYEAETLAQQKRVEAESLLGFMVGDFADKLRSVKRMDLLDGISNKALEYFSNQDTQQSSFLSLLDTTLNKKSQFQHAQTLQAMGEVAYSRGKTQEAEQAFSTAKELLGDLLLTDNANLDLLKMLGANAFWLGQLKYDESDFEGAKPYYYLYKKYSEIMYGIDPEGLDSLVELYNSDNILGSVYLELQDYAKAKLSFESSLTYNNTAILLFPNDNLLLSDKADTLSWIATTEQHLGNLTRTTEHLKEGNKTLVQVLKVEPNNAAYVERLAYSNWMLGKLMASLNNYSTAYKHISEALILINQVLEQDPNNKKWATDNLELTLTKASYAEKLNLPLNENLLIEMISQIDKENLNSNIIIETITYFQNKGDWANSLHYIELFKSNFLDKRTSNFADPKYLLASAKYKLLQSRQLSYEGKVKQKENLCANAINLLKPLLTQSHNYEYLIPYVTAHKCLDKTSEVNSLIQYLVTIGIEQN